MNRFLTITVLACLIAACNQSPKEIGPRYESVKNNANEKLLRFAVHPLFNPAKLGRSYGPLIDFLNESLPGNKITLEASRNYANYEEKIRRKAPDILLPNPWQTLEAIKAGYEVIAMAGDPADFKGIFIVRKDSPIRTPEDLMGKTVSYPAPTALAACIMPQYYLHEHGIDVSGEIENRYVGSQESSIMNAYLEQTAIAATWPPPWRAFQKDHPREAAELKLLWETPSLVNNSVMVRKDLPAGLKNDIRGILLSLHTTKEGKDILARMETARFYDANNKSYNIVRDYIARFEKDVRKVRAQ